MKKTFILGLIAAALGFTACSEKDNNISENTQEKGMVQLAVTRAALDNKGDTWQFGFKSGDEIKVTNRDLTSGTYYTFENKGEKFRCEDATPTSNATDWYAYYPSDNVDLTAQEGSFAGAASLYALAGVTGDKTTGENGLNIDLKPQVAILKINSQLGSIDIKVKTSATTYVTGLTAKSGAAGFDVATSTTETSLLKKTATGTYYVVVPAGVQLAIKDGDKELKATGTNGLTAGKYYALTIAEQPFTLTAKENGSKVKIGFSDFQYKTSTQQNWQDYTANTEIELNTGESVQFKAKTGSTHKKIGTNFSMTAGSFDASGNIMSLLAGNVMAEQAFQNLFMDCHGLKGASELLLPATTLAQACYQYMFSGCFYLVSAPALPATELASECYDGMFDCCNDLVSAPALPATTLAPACYQDMFSCCNSLVSAPALPATSLASNCYSAMFGACTSLVNAPELPATTLASDCYYQMFRGCTSLVNAPALPATTLAGECYRYMFGGCTNLVSAPALPATTLADYCYYQMFKGCTSLKSVKVNFTTWDPSTTTEWLDNVSDSSSCTFTCPSALPDERGSDMIPYNWVKVDI